MKRSLKQPGAVKLPASRGMAELPRVVKWFQTLPADERYRVATVLGLFGNGEDLAAQQRRLDAAFDAVRKAHFPKLHADWRCVVLPDLLSSEVCHRGGRIIYLQAVPRVHAELVATIIGAVVRAVCGGEGADLAHKVIEELNKSGTSRVGKLLAEEFGLTGGVR